MQPSTLDCQVLSRAQSFAHLQKRKGLMLSEGVGSERQNALKI